MQPQAEPVGPSRLWIAGPLSHTEETSVLPHCVGKDKGPGMPGGTSQAMASPSQACNGLFAVLAHRTSILPH